MKKIILLTITLISLSGQLQAGSPDSLIAAFEKQPNAATGDEFLSILQRGGLMGEKPSLTSRTPEDTLRMHIWFWASQYYYAVQNYNQAITYGKKAMKLIPKGSETEADCQNLFAIAYLRMGQYEESAEHAKRCFELDQESGDPSRISSSLNTLSAIYLAANQPTEAEKYVCRGIEMAKKSGEPYLEALLQGMASEIYHALGKDTIALKYINEAYRIDSIEGRTDKLYNRIAQKASILIGLHQYAEAEKLLLQCIPYLEKIGDIHSLGIACNKMGMTLRSQDRPEEAVPYFQKATEIFTSQGDPYNEIHSRRGLYELLWEKDPAEAKVHLDRFNDLRDSIYSSTSAECLARYNAEFGNDWLTLENHAERKAKFWAINVTVIITILALLIGIYLYYRNRNQIRLNEKLRAVLAELQTNSISENPAETTPQEEKTESAFMKELNKTIEEQMSTGRMEVTRIAHLMNMSPFQFRQELAKNTDETAQNYIQNIRINRACLLLRQRSDLNIQEVAYLCGYGETANFTRAFKRVKGQTPSEYKTDTEDLG